jgi:hypothetical protein
MVDPSQFIDQVSAAISEDGRTAELQIIRANGQTTYLQFPSEGAASVLLAMEQQLAKVFEMQRARIAGQDPRSFFPIGAKRVKKVQGAIGMGNIPVLSFELESGLRLDLAIDHSQIHSLIEWLEGLESDSLTPSPPRN